MPRPASLTGRDSEGGTVAASSHVRSHLGARCCRPGAALANTIAIVATESLVERGLRAVAASGQLADRVGEKLEWLSFFSLPNRVAIDDVDVRFNTDAVLCTLTSALTGFWGFIMLTLGSVHAAVSSTSFNKRTPGFWQGQRLPGSDVFPRVDITSAGTPSSGILHIGGTFWLAPDEISTFVATQLLAVSEATGEVTVVDGARVELSELGAPPPAGDDNVQPADFTSRRG